MSEQAETPEAPRVLTEDDYKLDLPVLFGVLGINPGHVKAGTARLTFPDSVPVLEYEVMRPVPTQQLGVAILQSGQKKIQDNGEGEEGGEGG